MSGDFTTYSRDMPKLFFSCLKPHEFDRANKLVRLSNGLTISIGAVFDDPEILKLPDLTKLYSPGNKIPSQGTSSGGTPTIHLDELDTMRCVDSAEREGSVGGLNLYAV